MNDHYSFGMTEPGLQGHSVFHLARVVGSVVAVGQFKRMEEISDMSLSFSDAAKAKQLREYFNRHGRIYIVVDATRDEVVVPESLHGDPALRLVLNVRMPQTIRIQDDRLDSDFSFSGQIFGCQIPMHTIWAAY